MKKYRILTRTYSHNGKTYYQAQARGIWGWWTFASGDSEYGPSEVDFATHDEAMAAIHNYHASLKVIVEEVVVQ